MMELSKKEEFGLAEADLIKQLKQGNVDALQTLIDTYGGYVAAVIAHTLGTQAQKEDYEEQRAACAIRTRSAAGLAMPGGLATAHVGVPARPVPAHRVFSLTSPE